MQERNYWVMIQVSVRISVVAVEVVRIGQILDMFWG